MQIRQFQCIFSQKCYGNKRKEKKKPKHFMSNGYKGNLLVRSNDPKNDWYKLQPIIMLKVWDTYSGKSHVLCQFPSPLFYLP